MLEHQVVAAGERLVLGRSDGSGTTAVSVKDPRWPALVDLLPSGPVRDAIAPVIGVRALMVSSDERRRIQRVDLRNGEGKTVARVELDEPASPAASPAKLTVRRLRGYDEQARRAARLAGGVGPPPPAASPAKLTVRRLRGYDEQARRADRLLVGLGLRAVEQGEDQLPGPAQQMPVTDRAVPATALLAVALSGFLATMRENLPGLLDDVDTEFLHDFRVAVRRTRATLKLGRPALPEVMRTRWEPAFKSLGDLTTPLRDLDVYQLDLPSMSHWLVTADPTDLDPLATHLGRRRAVARRELASSLRSTSFRRLVMQWAEELAWLQDQPEGGGRKALSAGRLADGSISRAHARVARGGGGRRGD